MEKNYVTKDSGARQEWKTGSVRDLATGKGRYDLIPTDALRRLAGLYERGAAKYGDRNWEKGQPLMRYIDSLLRHTNCLVAGEPEEDHAAAIAWNAFGYMHTLAEIEAGRLPKELDDRPRAEPQYSAPKPVASQQLELLFDEEPVGTMLIGAADQPFTNEERDWFAIGERIGQGERENASEDLMRCNDPTCQMCPLESPLSAELHPLMRLARRGGRP